MDNQKHLLSLKSEDSLNLMLGSANNIRYPIHGLKVSDLESLGTTKTKVKLTARERAGPDDPYRIKGSTDFSYKRLDISDYFNSLLDTFKPPLPCTTQVFLDEITRLTGLEFETRDFEHKHITRNNASAFKIKAKSESLRWVGEIELSITTYPDITNLPNSHLQFDTNPKAYSHPQLLNPFVNVTSYQLSLYPLTGNYAYPPIGVKFQNLHNNQRIHILNALTQFGVSHSNEWNFHLTQAFNSYVVDYKAQPAYNPFKLFNDKIKYAIHYKVDLDYWTLGDCEDIYLWYAEHELDDIQIDIGAAVKHNGLSGYDGSGFSSWFHSLQNDQFIATSPNGNATIPLEPNQVNKQWVLNPAQLLKRNIFMAFVRYNGPKRAQDSNSIYPNLTHVTEWILNPQYCYSPIGNIKIYYN